MPMKSSRSRSIVCHYWKQGRCNRNPCRFVHGDLQPAGTKVVESLPSSSNSHRPNVYRAPQTQKSQALVPGDLRRKLSPLEEDRVSKRTKSSQLPAAATQMSQRKQCSSYVDGVLPSQSPSKPASANTTSSPKQPDAEVDDVAVAVVPTTSEHYEEKKAACCQDWMSGNCGRGESCQFLHSWCRGDGFSMLARLIEEGHDGEKSISGIGFPAGSDKLYSATSGGVVRAWDCHTGLLAGTANVGDHKIGCLISDEDWVFVGFPNGVKAWNFKLGVYHDLTGPKGQVNALEFGLDALYAGFEDGAISIWKGFTDQQANPQFQQPATYLRGHGSAVTCLRATINGELYRRLYSGSVDGTIKVWDLYTEECIQTLKAHDGAVTSVICWNTFLLSCSMDKKVKFWGCTEDDSDDISLLYTHEEESAALALGGMNDSAGKPILFCSWSNCSVGLYELPTLKEFGRIYSQKEVSAIRNGPEGLFFTGDASGVVSVWKLLAEVSSSGAKVL
ncbi:unnamed protein product [Linum tenue]|uniref:C3H1-type domain-containing protein n=1 Tax=Linum tenue TaxID=586396 RepID=A0AAV0LI07_9ROSI|nr:unnamed protein product [Linum tenue]CAI0433845.1 unnamed protein product [Linum tenue]